VVSIWGNDLTLFAERFPLISRETKQVLRRADALHCDCERDLQLAVRSWGSCDKKLSVVLPSSGGIKTSVFWPGESDYAFRAQLDIPDGAQVVFNPRGLRGYVRNDVFFKAIPQVLKQRPNAVFVCTGMRGNPIAEAWVSRLDIKANVRLLPSVPREQMAELFRGATIAVSPSIHDGTPNTLLEAMASGCFPVSGDIESIREWITDGENGLLCDPTSPESLARAIESALGNEQMRKTAREQNTRLIADRARYSKVMQRAEEFYIEVVRNKQQALQV
jgi:glycosyltransferase involved in cell wall biosynthesis